MKENNVIPFRVVSGSGRSNPSLPTHTDATGLHNWVPSPLGHGNYLCTQCAYTDLEAHAVGKFEHCDYAPRPTTPTA